MGIDELFRLNPKEKGQDRSVLERLLQIQAANADLLLEMRDQLIDRDLPTIGCAGQIAQPIPTEAGPYEVQGATAGSLVTLDFRPVFSSIDPLGNCCASYSPIPNAIATAEGTQVVAYTSVAQYKARYYADYVDAMTDDGPLDVAINPNASPHYRGRRRTPQTWEGEMVGHVRGQFTKALGWFCRAYSHLTRREIQPTTVYGFFVMLNPGRVVTGDAERPLLSSLFDNASPRAPTRPSRSALTKAIDQRWIFADDFVARVLAYQRIGETAGRAMVVVGLVAIIEEFLSQSVPWPTPEHRPSITESLRRAPLSNLPGNLLERLRSAAKLRNDLVHRKIDWSAQHLISPPRAMIDLAIDAYGAIRGAGYGPPPQP